MEMRKQIKLVKGPKKYVLSESACDRVTLIIDSTELARIILDAIISRFGFTKNR
jgi:hypothetical protein